MIGEILAIIREILAIIREEGGGLELLKYSGDSRKSNKFNLESSKPTCLGRLA